jgi:hypothetical protein
MADLEEEELRQKKIAARLECGKRLRDALADFVKTQEGSLSPDEIILACFEMVSYNLGFMNGLAIASGIQQDHLLGTCERYALQGRESAQAELLKKGAKIDGATPMIAMKANPWKQ